VAAFLNNPKQLLSDNQVGGGRLIARVRDLLLSDSATLPTLLGLLADANNDQKSALAAGLAQAARLWVRVNPTFAQQIQQSVANSKDSPFIVAFSTALGDVPIGALAAGGSDGALGGQTSGLAGAGGGFGGGNFTGNFGTATGNFTATGSAVGSGNSSANTSTTTTTNASTSTSP
jgi:hypothetical protein